MLELTKLPAYYIEKYSREKVAEIVGQTTAVIGMWLARDKFPIDAVDKLLAFDPGPLHTIQPLYTTAPEGEKLAILVPLTGSPQPKMMDNLLRLYDRREMSYDRFGFNALHVGRNVLAAKWLKGTAPWAYWQDGDNVVPCGDASWFKSACDIPTMPDVYAGLNTIHRMLVHKTKQGKPANIVSVCYPARKRGGNLQFGGGHTLQIKNDIRRGPRDELREVPWVGFGGVLTHRSVFEDIIRTQGDEIRMKPGGIGEQFGYEYGFFHPIDLETPGDDIPFCQRAARAGHKCYVDLAVMAGHGVGDRLFTYQDV